MDNTEFAIADIAPGKLNALVKNLMRQMGITDPSEAVRRINSGEWIVFKPVCNWREKDGVIYFSVTSDGTTGEEWIKRLEGNGFYVGDHAKQLLLSSDFKTTSGVTTEVAVLKGLLFNEQSLFTSEVYAEAEKRKLSKPHTELACLIRVKFTDKEIEAMDVYWIVTMHEPINVASFGTRFLTASPTDHRRSLVAISDILGERWSFGTGFAFVVSQVSSQS